MDFSQFLISILFVGENPDILKSANYWQILMEPLSWIYFIFAKSQLNGKSALSCSRHFPIVLTRRWSLIHLGTICDNFFFNIEKQSWILEKSPIFGNHLYAFLWYIFFLSKVNRYLLFTRNLEDKWNYFVEESFQVNDQSQWFTYIWAMDSSSH